MIMEAVKTTAEGTKVINTTQVKAFGTREATASLEQLTIQRRKPTPHDVEIEILYCGVCHSDLHTARNEWHGTIYPCVPGHEIVGRIVNVGPNFYFHFICGWVWAGFVARGCGLVVITTCTTGAKSEGT